MALPGSNICQGWNDSFWNGIDLGDLVSESYSRIGTTVLPPGSPVGRGLQEGATSALGLPPGTPVGTAIIDAHAGGLGMLTNKQNKQTNKQNVVYSRNGGC